MQVLLARDINKIAAYERVRDPWLVRPGNPVRIQVVDYDRDISPLADTIAVRVKASSGDEVASVPLVETEPHSDLFRGVLKTAKAPPRATASDSAPGSDPNAAIAAAGAGWKSAPGGAAPKWLDVDLMTIHPLAWCEADCAGGGAVKDLSLFGAVGGADLELIASTKPSREQVNGYVDLARHFGAVQNTAAYLYTELVSETNQTVTLKVGSCDGVAVWVNGKPVLTKLAGRIWKPEEDVVQVPLQAGRNGVVVKVAQINGPWGCSLRVLKADGAPLPSMPAVPPALPGVVTQWHLFNRPTPEEGIQFGATVSVDQPVRIKD
jgi:hypothetical protein